MDVSDIPRQLQERWSRRAPHRTGSDTAAREVFQKQLAIVGAMRKAGVPILAGTDTGNPFCFPDFSLHEELALLVVAGLTPLEALQTATLNPAKFLGLEKTLGTIEEGKIADLVLLQRKSAGRHSQHATNPRSYIEWSLIRSKGVGQVARRRAGCG